MADGRMVARAWSLRPAPFGKTMLGKGWRLGRGLCGPILGTCHPLLGRLGPGLKGPLPWRDPFTHLAWSAGPGP